MIKFEPYVDVYELLGNYPMASAQYHAVLNNRKGSYRGNNHIVTSDDYEKAKDLLFGIGFNLITGEIYASIDHSESFFEPIPQSEIDGELSAYIDTDYDEVIGDFRFDYDQTSGEVFIEIKSQK